MSKTVISVNNLGKRYRIGVKAEIDKNFREDILNAIKSPFRNFKKLRKLTNFDNENGESSDDTIWALKDVSFEVKEGEVVGIIGKNGSGKSTLLKILSRITEPTKGCVKIKGRISSLLEVGTGFHPELTGRENIYLNGSILGMRKWEIDKKFDEIVAFSEIEKFLDTPVKRYSSGMYVRLAFAVAAHLEPEILLVDEVLAVGDIAFQKKCLGKMSEVAKKGRTVLLVSHNMGAIENLCNRTLLLDRGHIVLSGETHTVVSSYLTNHNQNNGNPFLDCYRTGNGRVRVVSFHLESQSGKVLQVARTGAPVVFVFEFENKSCDPKDQVSFGFSVHTDREFGLFHYYSHFSNVHFNDLPLKGYFKCLIPEISLAPGNYLIHCRMVINGDQSTGEEVDWPRVFVPVTIAGGDFYETGNDNLSTWGPLLVKGNWSICKRSIDAHKF